MKTKIICWSLLVIGAAVVGARGESFRTDINPALLYGRAFLLAPDLSQADSDYLLNTNNWQGQHHPERAGKLLAQYDNEFKLIRQAAHSTVPCDWGIDMSAGPATLLPGLARVKAVSVTTRLRVQWHLQNGREADACEELLAAFALARNASQDGTLISVLVQIASEAINCSTIAANFGRFSPETLLNWRVALPTVGGIALVLVVGLLVTSRPRPEIPLPAPSSPQSGLAHNLDADFRPTIANYQMVANQSLEKLDQLLSEQGSRKLPPAPIYTASAFMTADVSN